MKTFLEHDFWTPPTIIFVFASRGAAALDFDLPQYGVCLSERFLDPPAPPHINFVHDEIGKLVFIYYYLGLGLVIRHFMGRALRPWVRLVKTVSRPRATARTGLGAERCGHMSYI